MGVRLKVVRPTGERYSLRIYWYGPPPCCGGWSYHNAFRHLRDERKERVAGEFMDLPPEKVEDFPDPAAWPSACSYCGTPVPSGHFLNRLGAAEDAPQYQVFGESLWDDPPRPPLPGDVWDAWWAGPPDTPPFTKTRLAVQLPNGDFWENGKATNCTHGAETEAYHCDWTVTGEPPNITVRASILSNAGKPTEWHGFITDGVLEPDYHGPVVGMRATAPTDVPRVLCHWCGRMKSWAGHTENPAKGSQFEGLQMHPYSP